MVRYPRPIGGPQNMSQSMPNKYKILVVEDTCVNFEALNSDLPNHFECKNVHSGVACLSESTHFKPDIILIDIDIKVEGMSGLDTCKTLKSSPQFDQTPVIFLGSNDQHERIVAGYQAGGSDYISKPIHADEFEEKTNRILKRKKENQAIESELSTSVNMANLALINLGEQGVILNFFSDSFKCTDFEDLVDLILISTESFNLLATVQIRAETHTITKSSTLCKLAIDSRQFEYFATGARVVTFNSNTFFIDQHVSISLQDFEEIESDKKGRIRDHITQLIQGAESRIQALIVEKDLEVKATQEHILLGLLRTALCTDDLHLFLKKTLNTLTRSVPWLTEEGMIYLTEEEGFGALLNIATQHLAPHSNRGNAFHALLETLANETNLRTELPQATSQDASSEHSPSSAEISPDNASKSASEYTRAKSYMPSTTIIASKLKFLSEIDGSPAPAFHLMPIKHNDIVLGVIVIFPTLHRPISDQEHMFLEQVSDIVRMGITLRYSQNSLETAKSDAEAASLAKGQFLATMSHELRTPMNGVLGMLHLLGKTNLNLKQKAFTKTAIQSGGILLRLINNVLDYSKLEAEEIILESIPFNPEALIDEIGTLMSKDAHAKGIELICSVPAEIPTYCEGDPNRLQQILVNLVTNAIKFTDHGEVVLYAAVLPGNQLYLGVCDTGIGISDLGQRKLFKCFSQVDNSHSRRFGGTGLGLAICQHLVDAMEGEIRVASAPGFGSDFSFSIPLKALQQPTDENHALESGCLPTQGTSQLRAQRILVVDDNRAALTVTESILKNLNIALVSTAENGDDALKQLRATQENQPYTIVLIDQHMPELSGSELAQMIRNDSALKEIKILLLHDITTDKHSPLADCWLTKPVLRSDLHSKLIFLIGESDTQDDKSGLEHHLWWFGGYKLLLVEDNQVNQEVAIELLSEVGFELEICSDGLEALNAVQIDHYDIILMDVQMPIMDGFEATRRIRALGGDYEELPIIAITANALIDDTDKCLTAGMNAHTTKPIVPNKLYRELSRWIEPGEKPIVATEEIDVISGFELPELPGIDIAEGLAHLHGNEPAFKRILKGFVKKHNDSSQKLHDLLERGQTVEIAQLAHSLKGSGGTIGATHIYKNASALEKTCNNKDSRGMQGLVPQLAKNLDEVIEGLAEFINKMAHKPDHTTKAHIALSQLTSLLKGIASDLDSDLGDAQNRLESIQQQTRGLKIEAPLNELIEAVLEFDIETAKVLIETLTDNASELIQPNK